MGFKINPTDTEKYADMPDVCPPGPYVVVGTHVQSVIIKNGSAKYEVTCRILKAVHPEAKTKKSTLAAAKMFVGEDIRLSFWRDFDKKGNQIATGQLSVSTHNREEFDPGDIKAFTSIATGVPFVAFVTNRASGDRVFIGHDKTLPVPEDKLGIYTDDPDFAKLTPSDIEDRITQEKDFSSPQDGTGGNRTSSPTPDDADSYYDSDFNF